MKGLSRQTKRLKIQSSKRKNKRNTKRKRGGQENTDIDTVFSNKITDFCKTVNQQHTIDSKITQQYPPGTQKNNNGFALRNIIMEKGKGLEFPEGPEVPPITYTNRVFYISMNIGNETLKFPAIVDRHFTTCPNANANEKYISFYLATPDTAKHNCPEKKMMSLKHLNQKIKGTLQNIMKKLVHMPFTKTSKCLPKIIHIIAMTGMCIRNGKKKKMILTTANKMSFLIYFPYHITVRTITNFIIFSIHSVTKKLWHMRKVRKKVQILNLQRLK
jgi:hypothetical protein